MNLKQIISLKNTQYLLNSRSMQSLSFSFYKINKEKIDCFRYKFCKIAIQFFNIFLKILQLEFTKINFN